MSLIHYLSIQSHNVIKVRHPNFQNVKAQLPYTFNFNSEVILQRTYAEYAIKETNQTVIDSEHSVIAKSSQFTVHNFKGY